MANDETMLTITWIVVFHLTSHKKSENNLLAVCIAIQIGLIGSHNRNTLRHPHGMAMAFP